MEPTLRNSGDVRVMPRRIRAVRNSDIAALNSGIGHLSGRLIGSQPVTLPSRIISGSHKASRFQPMKRRH